jgi:hypothetical protein
MTTTINASPTNGIVQSADGSGVLKVQSNGVTTNAIAWVNFNGTTSPGTIRSAYNVSSVTKAGTGDYVVNFASALADANYSAVASGGRNASSGGYLMLVGDRLVPTTTALQMYTITYAGATADTPIVSVVVFGN